MGDGIKHCLANLTNLQGRDTRTTFWSWMLVIVVVTVIISMISGVVFAASSLTGAIQAGADSVDQAEMQAEMMRNMAGGLKTQAWIGVIMSLVGLALLFATFVRRLRDAGLPTLIAAVPVATVIYSSYVSLSLVDKTAEVFASGDLDAINALAASNGWSGAIGWIGYLVVIVCGCIPGGQGHAD